MIVLAMWCLALTSVAQGLDISLLKEINLYENKGNVGAMRAVTNSVYPVAIAIPLAELAEGYIAGDKKMINAGYTTVAGAGLNFIVAFGLKYAVNRDRPYVTYPYLHPYQHDKDPSFPSGHTSFAFNTATSLLLCHHKWYITVPAYTWAATVGYSRMYLGMHYPSDVLAGAVVGSATSLLAFKGNQWLQRHKKTKRHSLEP